MTKKQKILSGQTPLFIFETLQEAKKSIEQINGSLNIASQIKNALAEDLKHAQDENGREISRAQVAARMTDLVGEEITLSMLNNWTATSHPHEMPLSYLPAFIKATGGQRRTADLISQKIRPFLFTGPEALRAEIQRLDEKMKEMKIEKQKRILFLKHLEGKI